MVKSLLLCGTISPAFQALKKMKNDWEVVEFNFIAYKDTGVHILSAIDDVQVQLDDHTVKTSTMKGSSFIGPFEHEINEWDQKLVITRICQNTRNHRNTILFHVYWLLNLAFYVKKYSSIFLQCVHRKMKSGVIFLQQCIFLFFVTAPNEGNLGLMVESSVSLAVSGAYLQFSGYQKPDPNGGKAV